MKKLLYSPRVLFFVLFLLSVIGTAYALYLQYALQLLPCNLCILQRVGLWTMGAFSLVFALVNPKRAWLQWGLWGLSLAGILWSAGVAARHIWLTYLPPDQVPACGASLEYLLEAVPVMQALKEVLNASGECAAVTWRLLGLSIPEQSLVFFVALLLGHGWLAVLLSKAPKTRPFQ